MEWLCALTIGLAVIAAIGHGLWVLAATLLRELFGTKHEEKQPGHVRPFTRCPACRADVELRDNECPFCGLLLDTRMASQLARVARS